METIQTFARASSSGSILLQPWVLDRRQDGTRPGAVRVDEVHQHGLAAEAERRRHAPGPSWSVSSEVGGARLASRPTMPSRVRASPPRALDARTSLQRPPRCGSGTSWANVLQLELGSLLSRLQPRQDRRVRHVEVHRHRRHEPLDLAVLDHDLAEIGLHVAYDALRRVARGRVAGGEEREGDDPRRAAPRAQESSAKNAASRSATPMRKVFCIERSMLRLWTRRR